MIDIHTHLHPPRLFAAIRRWFAQRSEWDLTLAPTEPEAVATVLRAAAVKRFVFCSYAHKPGMARALNAWLVKTSEELGHYGLPLATVHPDDPGYRTDLQIALDGGCIGLKLHEDVQNLAADDPRFDPVYRTLAAHGAFLLVHAGAIPWRYVPGDGVGRIGRVLERHPQLTVVVAHYGVPDTERYYELMERHPSLYLDTTMIFAPDSPMLAPEVASLVGTRPERVLYGTDYPNVPHPYSSERAGLEALGLSAAALNAILHDNAERIIARALAMRGSAWVEGA
jgi:predicted TIM-barrel fold metal-dependent hydrolase